MGRPKKQPPGIVHFDIANAYSIPGAIEATRISVGDIFRHGTWEDIRDNWDLIAAKLEAGRPLTEVETKYLVQALRQMCAKGAADPAFGVTRKGLSPSYVKSTMYLATSLQEQGLNSEDAWDRLARLDLVKYVFRDYKDRSPGEALRKKIQRAYRRMFGGVSRTKMP